VVYRRTVAGQARLDAQRARIVAAATHQLAEQGYGACSIAAVAQRAGVASGTVYNHVAGKAELVAEVFRAVVGREVAAVRAAVAAENDTAGRVTAFVETFASRALKSPRLAYALLTEPVDPAVDELRLEFRVAFRDIALDVIEGGIAGDELPKQDGRVVAAALVGAIGEALAGPLSGRPDPATVPTLVAFALRSLGVRDAAHA
jgi:AcrR family transcriptional regulator